MAIADRPANTSDTLSKNVHGPSTPRASELPRGAVLADLLKTIETQLAAKGYLCDTTDQHFNPIWYLAETERNVFLWKRGCSLVQHDEFEFWVDLPALIDKRLKQLSSFNGNNPFLNPLWGIASSDPESAARERDYLLSFRDALSRIEELLHDISKLGSALLEEQRESSENKERVVLPAFGRAP